MNEYVRGAFDALSWIQTVLEEEENKEEVLKRVEEALRKIKHGAGGDFKFKLDVLFTE